MDTAIQRIVQPFAEPGERLIWCGQPTRDAAALSNWMQSLIGLGFLAITGLLIVVPDDSSPEPSISLIVLGLPFLAVGFWMASRTLRDYFMAEHTFYGVTDQHILIVRTWPSRSVRSYIPDDIQYITTTENPDGSGDVQFRKEYFGAVRNANAIPERIGFWGVPDAHGVSLQIHTLKTRPPKQPDGQDETDENKPFQWPE
jgi:hypothetical protein